MAILFDKQTSRWLLQGKNVSYGLGVDKNGTLQHLYFGSKLPFVSDLPDVNTAIYHSSFEPSGGITQPEYPAWGGMYYYEPCLKATFSDHVRDTRLVYKEHQITENEQVDELVIVLQDTVYPLFVHLHYRLFPEHDVIERYAVIENTGTTPITLEQALSGSWHTPRGDRYRLTHLGGKWIEETQIYQDEITPGKKTLESRRGNTGAQANPWFAIDRGTADEDQGEVWFGALGWSGNWKITVEYNPFKLLQVSGGIHDFDFAWHLEGGKSFQTPAFVGGYTRLGFGQASRNFHDYQRNHVLPKPIAEQVRPVLYNSWEATYFDVTEQGQMALAERAAAIGVELFVVDDGWFGERHHDRAGLGDWTVNPVKFPNGLKPLIDKVESLGMRFGIWVEPEMVNPDSDLYRKNPDWIYHFPNRPRTESRNQCVLNVSKPEVQEFIFKMLDDLLSENNIDFIKWDMNRSFSEPGWPDAPQAIQKEIWVRHVQGLYDILARLRAKHPKVAFESCSGGGARIDLGIMRLTDEVWTSDNTEPYERLFIQEGYSLAYNAQTMMCWVADSAKWVKNRPAPVAYRFHSSMMGSLGIGGNLTQWSEEELAESTQLIEEYKSIRHIVQKGNQYRLLSPRKGNTTAVQYVTHDQSESVLFALMHPQKFQNPSPRIYLRGLKSDSLYKVTDIEEPISGSALMNRGIDVNLHADLASKLLKIREVK
ncbi:alpha-galactosidase [Paenibacillus sp. JCM 10914]|uniref:alpha-galactosidase n=1 Tax=Paenibacillus sp. JCM 10914 TaxID=1236974 RepID=UPI001E2CDB32|nr:alpha-galactosidase [Paenibacillus sp. JCM 10914]